MWTQIFGSKASEPETSHPVKECDFFLLHLHLALTLQMTPFEFHKDL